MKAYRLYAVNDLRYEDIEIPKIPCSDWCIVKVYAAGICSSDIPRIFKKGTYHFPTIPGHEFSGEVFSVGENKYSNLVGKKVGVFPLIPCRKCSQCMEKKYEMCANYDYVGSRRDGGFAEYVAVPIWNLIELPKNMPYTSAAMLEPLSVALHAVKTGGMKKGEHVAIIGTGMIGISAGQWAYKKGAASVTVIGRSEAKRTLVETCGLHYVNSSVDDLKEYDFVIEAVGSQYTIQQAISQTRPEGTVLLMGNPFGDINLDQNVYWKILRKQLLIKGTWNSKYNGKDFSDWTEAVKAIANNEINIKPLISHQYSEDKLFDGLKLMYNKQEPYCKVMTIWNKKTEI